MRETLFRGALRCYPPEFRDRFGDEFVAFAEARREESAYHGAIGALRFWGALALDVARSAPPARLRALGDRVSGVPHPSPPPDDRMGTLRSDLRLALRTLARRPGFTAVVAFTLALGIGANTAIFGIVDPVLFRPLPLPHAERLVVVQGIDADGGPSGVSYPEFVDLRAGVRAFEELGAMRAQSVNLTGVERPDRLYGMFATASVLRLVGAGAAVGRPLSDAETEFGTRAPVAMLSHDAWRARFGRDPGVVGRTVTLNGLPFTVIGVVDSAATVPAFGSPDVWLPLPYYPNAQGLERGDRSMALVGRLRGGVTLATADAQAAGVMRVEAERYPETNARTSARVAALKEYLVGDVRQPLALVMGAVGVLLLIACLNVANLQLARAIARARETATRAALGASRARLARQLLTESMVLAALGGALGVALGHALLALLVKTVGDALPPLVAGRFAIDARVLAAAAVATAGSGALAGLLPLWQASRGGAFGLGARDASASREAMRGRSALVVGQMALSVVLLATAGLLAHSLLELRRVRPGFDPANLLTFEFRLPAAKYDAPEKIAGMFARTIESIRAVPGARSAALVRAVPFGGNMETAPTAFDGRAVDDPAHALAVHVNVVSDGYFATIGLPLRLGRDFDARDDARAPMVAVVSEELARRAWPGQSPLGRRLRAEGWPEWATVVGVVAGAKHLTLAEALRPQVYVHFRQRPLIFTSVVVRTTGDPMALAESVRRAVWRVDPDQPMWKVRSMETMLAGSVGGARALAAVTTTFALAALALAAVGVFGVMSFAVAQRRRELGIRLALGARAAQVTAMVVRHGLRLTAVALTLGLAGALGAGRLLAGQLYGVSPTDPATLAAVAGVLALVMVLACWVPARRAGRVDPKASLQSD